MLRLQNWIEEYLLAQAEYRMGVHKVIATLNSGSTETGIIINSTVFLKENEAPEQMRDGWESFTKEAGKSQLIVTNVKVIPREPETLRGVRQIAISNEKNARLAIKKSLAANSAFGTARDQLLNEARMYQFSANSATADEAPVTLTVANEVFKRFCAFANHRRVTPGKGLRPLTFATTQEDADGNIKTGTDAVKRYALPDPAPASNVFTIKPPQDIDLKRGTTQPAYNQPGGGVEVIFVNGSPDGSVSGPVKIPDK